MKRHDLVLHGATGVPRAKVPSNDGSIQVAGNWISPG